MTWPPPPEYVIAEWPISGAPKVDGYSITYNAAMSTTPAQVGTGRVVRTSTEEPLVVSAAWEIDAEELGVFRNWWANGISEGQDKFYITLYNGGGPNRVTARALLSANKPSWTVSLMQGLNWLLEIEFEVFGFPALAPPLSLDWPDTFPRPSKSGYRVSPFNGTIRTEIEKGVKHHRTVCGASGDTVHVSWGMSSAQFLLFGSWFSVAIRGGLAWHKNVVLTDTGFADVTARIPGGWQAAALPGERWLVSCVLETRRV